LVNKPLDWTSFDVVRKLKSVIKSKIGHCGTLDPLADGLLVIATGKMTKQIETVQSQFKVYTGVFFLGATRPSFDKETEVDKQYPIAHINSSLIESTVATLTGEIMQSPPMYSAIKKDGVRMYDLAREGITLDIPSRPQMIYEFEITDIQLPLIRFRIKCNKGTYIRSIANEFGRLLGSGAYLDQLTRTQIGDFMLSDALNPLDLVELLKNQKLSLESDLVD